MFNLILTLEFDYIDIPKETLDKLLLDLLNVCLTYITVDKKNNLIYINTIRKYPAFKKHFEAKYPVTVYRDKMTRSKINERKKRDDGISEHYKVKGILR